MHEWTCSTRVKSLLLGFKSKEVRCNWMDPLSYFPLGTLPYQMYPPHFQLDTRI